MRILDANQTALSYWRTTGYTDADMASFLEEFDTVRLAARITFRPDEAPLISISKKTWEMQSGHYISISNFFKDVAAHPLGIKLSGSIIVWLDDGIYSYESHSFMKAPVLGFCRSIFDNHSLLIPDPAFIETNGYEKNLKAQAEFEYYLPFEERIPTIFWRGAASGIGFTGEGWKKTHRGCLTLKSVALNKPELLDAAFSKVEGWPDETIASIKAAGVVGDKVPFLDFLKYRYLVDADGITCAWISLYRKLASQSVTVKMMGENIQWYYHLMKPWEHYVPLRSDAEDIELIFDWLNHHPSECKRISQNANALIASISYTQEVEGTARLIGEILKCRRETGGVR